MPRLKVLIVDDHTLFREGLKFILGKCEDIVVVGEANDGIEAMKKVKRHKPHIVLLDITMPKLSGIDTLREIKSVAPKTNVIVLTMHAKDQYINEVLVNGANGYVLKDSASEDLISAINAVGRGEAYLSPSISKRLISQYSRDPTRPEALKAKEEKLTKREKEILRMISHELTTRQISQILYISYRTVENHRNNIMKKLNIHSKVGLVKYAIETGLVNEPHATV